MKKFKLVLKLFSIFIFLLSCLHSIARAVYAALPQVQEFFTTTEGLENYAEIVLELNEYSIGLIVISTVFVFLNCLGVSWLFKNDNKARLTVWLVPASWVAIYIISAIFHVYLMPILVLYSFAMFRLATGAKHMFDVALEDYTVDVSDEIHDSKTHITAYDAQIIVDFPYVKHLVAAFMYAIFCLLQFINHCAMLYYLGCIELYVNSEVSLDESTFYMYTKDAFSTDKAPFFVLASLIVAASVVYINKNSRVKQALICALLVIHTVVESYILASGLLSVFSWKSYIISTFLLIALGCNFFVLINNVLDKNKIKVSGKIVFYKLRCFAQHLCSAAYVILMLYFIVDCIVDALNLEFQTGNYVIDVFFGASVNMALMYTAIVVALSMMITYKSLSVSLTTWSLFTMMLVELFVYGDSSLTSMIYIAFALVASFMTLSVLKYVQLSLEQYALSIKLAVEQKPAQE